MKRDHIVYNSSGSPIMTVYRYLDKQVVVLTYWFTSKSYDVTVLHFKSNEDIYNTSENAKYGTSSKICNYTPSKVPKKYRDIVDECLKDIDNNEHLRVIFELTNVTYANIENGKVAYSR